MTTLGSNAYNTTDSGDIETRISSMISSGDISTVVRIPLLSCGEPYHADLPSNIPVPPVM